VSEVSIVATDVHAAIERELTRLFRAGERQATFTIPGTDRVLDKAGLRLLRHLTEHGDLRLSGLASLAAVDVSTASRQVAHLQEQGLLTREPDPGDRRACVLRVTPAGQNAVERLRQAHRDVMCDLLADWSVADRRELARLLARLNEDISERTRGGRQHLVAAPPAGQETTT
jgi:DNA-binding MarR family transcriptional regulator